MTDKNRERPDIEQALKTCRHLMGNRSLASLITTDIYVYELFEQCLEYAARAAAPVALEAVQEPVAWALRSRPNGPICDVLAIKKRPTNAPYADEYFPLYAAPVHVAEDARWQPMETAPVTKTILGVVDGAVRMVRYGKTSHVPIHGFCLADQGPEDFDLCKPSCWMPLPTIAALHEPGGEG